MSKVPTLEGTTWRQPLSTCPPMLWPLNFAVIWSPSAKRLVLNLLLAKASAPAT